MRVRPWEQLACDNELAEWLHVCYEEKRAGRTLVPDVFYERLPLLNKPEVVDAVINAYEDVIAGEIRNSPYYHIEHQGLVADATEARLRFPDREVASAQLRQNRWNRLPWAEKLAIVIGIDKVTERHRMTEDDEERERAEQALAARRSELASRLYHKVARENLAYDPHYYDNEMYG